MNGLKQIGVFEIIVGFFAISFSYWIAYITGIKDLNLILAILGVLIFLDYGILCIIAGVHNLKKDKKQEKKQ